VVQGAKGLIGRDHNAEMFMLIQIPVEGGHIEASESSVEWRWVGQKSLHFCVFPYGSHSTDTSQASGNAP
jgi:hypothetical protein